MADLSFIEDSVPFPEKEEDEEEEEEGVDWGYEEGNRPRVGRLAPLVSRCSGALGAPRVRSFPRASPTLAHTPGRFRGTRRSGESGGGRRLRSRRGARPCRRAAVGTCRGPEGEPEGCGGDISVLRVARRAALCCTQHLENTALVKLLVSFKKKFYWHIADLEHCVSFRCTAG